MPKLKPQFKNITIIGVGLLGGSIGLAIKRAFAGVKIAGVGRRRASLDKALAVGAIDSAYLDAAVPAASSDLVILATPVRSFARHMLAIAPVLPRGAIVTDVGSTKASVVSLAERILGKGARFVGSHPMAGSEQRGPAAARADLLKGALCILTPTPRTPSALTAKVERFWRALGMKTHRLPPAVHDKAVARISHLPHALSVLLMMLPGQADLAIAASGFSDMTRLAGGDVEMWRDIMLTNAKAILGAIDDFDEKLMHLRYLVELGYEKEIVRLLTATKLRRDAFAHIGRKS